MAKISVIVPVYNTEKYIARCLDSLLGQTQGDLEIILVDDCSEDKSLEIMAEYQEKNSEKIKLFQTMENGGPAVARNKGLDVATGQYIGFVDSDDFITLDLYEKMLTACEETASPLARTDRQIIYKNINLSFLGRTCSYGTKKVINPKEDSRYLITDPPCVTNKLFRRDLIAGSHFPERIKWEDYPFAVPLMVNASQIVTIPGKNYFYNIRLNGTTCRDARRLNENLLDIFTCSDMVGSSCINSDTNENVRYQINYMQMQNCVSRLKDIVNANIPLREKRELLTLVSNLINVKYGSWQDHPLYQEQCAHNPVHRLRSQVVEMLLLPANNFPQTEEELKPKIKKS